MVEYILDTLTPHCRSLGCPEGTAITSTRSMWHLGTRIEGELHDPDIPSVLLAAMLHRRLPSAACHVRAPPA